MKEIFIKIENVDEFLEILESIKFKEKRLKKNFELYNNLNQQENKIFENWNNYFEDITKKLEYITK